VTIGHHQEEHGLVSNYNYPSLSSSLRHDFTLFVDPRYIAKSIDGVSHHTRSSFSQRGGFIEDEVGTVSTGHAPRQSLPPDGEADREWEVVNGHPEYIYIKRRSKSIIHG